MTLVGRQLLFVLLEDLSETNINLGILLRRLGDLAGETFKCPIRLGLVLLARRYLRVYWRKVHLSHRIDILVVVLILSLSDLSHEVVASLRSCELHVIIVVFLAL